MKAQSMTAEENRKYGAGEEEIAPAVYKEMMTS